MECHPFSPSAVEQKLEAHSSDSRGLPGTFPAQPFCPNHDWLPQLPEHRLSWSISPQPARTDHPAVHAVLLFALSGSYQRFRPGTAYRHLPVKTCRRGFPKRR